MEKTWSVLILNKKDIIYKTTKTFEKQVVSNEIISVDETNFIIALTAVTRKCLSVYNSDDDNYLNVSKRHLVYILWFTFQI